MTTPPHVPSTPDPVPAPVPEGDVVPGEPLVPITVWYIPRSADDPAVPAALSRRLVANYVRPGRTAVDLTSTAATPRARRRPAELVIAQWPPLLPGSGSAGRPTATGPDPAAYLASCAEHLGPGGCLAVVVHEPRSDGALGVIVGAGHAIGLAYLQHIVVVHHLRSPETDAATDIDASLTASTDTGQLQSGRPHLRVHTDLLVFRTPGTPTHGPRSGRHA